MNLTFRHLSIVLLACSLSACLVEEEIDTDADKAVLDDDANTETNSATNSELSASLFNDGLIAPDAPELTISTEPGVMRFDWIDRESNPEDTVTQINLYEYNASSTIETQIVADIATSSTSYDMPIAAHQMAWDSLSYRVEICTESNCLSSLRMPVDSLLVDAIKVVQSSNADSSSSYGSDIALSADGKTALVSNPNAFNATVHYKNDNLWSAGATLTPTGLDQNTTTDLRVAMSATGDTMAIASLNDSSNPKIAVFDRLGETWIQTASVDVFNSNLASSFSKTWDRQSLRLKLSANGNRLIVGAHHVSLSNTSLESTNNRLAIFERGNLNWQASANLNLPAQHTRLSSFATSIGIDKVMALSAMNGTLHLHEYQLNNNQWLATLIQPLERINPSIDSVVVGSITGDTVAIAGWELDSANQLTPVAWKLERGAGGWIGTDSVRVPPATSQSAQLRLAGDGLLDTIAIGWQAANTASLDFFRPDEERWQRLFSVPRALSVVFSADNTTALVGASGGFFALSSP